MQRRSWPCLCCALALVRVCDVLQGVFVTLRPPAQTGGRMELCKLRFSRRHFSQQEAQQWWATHEAEIHDKYHVSRNSCCVIMCRVTVSCGTLRPAASLIFVLQASHYLLTIRFSPPFP